MTDPCLNSEFISNTRNLGKFNLALEIGCFEGMTSKYTCQNMLEKGGRLICVDPLQDEYLVENLNEQALKMNRDFTFFNGQYDKFVKNTNNLPIILYRKTFAAAFEELNKYRFDFIYVDGDHRGEAVYFDAVNSFKLLMRGGYQLYDDYLWETTNIKDGIDKFLTEYADRIKIVLKNYQVLIQKIK